MAKLTSDPTTFATDFFKADDEDAVMLGDPILDNMMTALISLGAEVWTNRRRVKVLERVLEDKGVTAQMIEAYMPTDDEASAWQTERDAFIRRTFGSLSRTGSKPLDAAAPTDSEERS
jgi:hypothetical protein